jgi:hypothetical protein
VGAGGGGEGLTEDGWQRRSGGRQADTLTSSTRCPEGELVDLLGSGWRRGEAARGQASAAPANGVGGPARALEEEMGNFLCETG